MSKHALISPSRSERACKCLGSTLAEAGLPDTAGPAAVEGSAAHAIAAYNLECSMFPAAATPAAWVGKMTREYLEYEPDEDDPRVGDVVITEEMMEGIDLYTSYVWEQTASRPQAELHVETKVAISSISEDISGTADAIIDEPFGDLHIIDLKFGRTLVEVDNNYQLSYYGLAALETFDKLLDHQRVLLTIVQPRGFHPHGPIRTIEKTKDELTGEWYPKFAGTYENVESQKNGFIEPEYLPGDWCDWCKNKLTCEALTSVVQEMALTEFEDADEDKRHDILGKTKAVEKYIEALKEWAHGELLQGSKVPGYKLVQTLGKRKWKDEEALEAHLGADIYRKVVQSPAQLKKHLGKEQHEAIEALCERVPGAPRLVKDTDKNPEYVAPSINDFEGDE